MAKGKDDEFFEKKPDIGIELIDRSLSRGHRPGIVLIDGGYGMGYNIPEKTRRKGIKILRKNRKKPFA